MFARGALCQGVTHPQAYFIWGWGMEGGPGLEGRGEAALPAKPEGGFFVVVVSFF